MTKPDVKSDLQWMAYLWYLFAVLFSLGGPGSLYFLVALPLFEFSDSHNWTRTPCAIVRAEVVERSSSTSSQRTTRMYSPVIEFSYSVQGKSYLSNRITLSGFHSSSSSDKNEALETLKPYMENASRTCLVNPNDPESAVLEAGFPTWSVILGGGNGGNFLCLRAVVFLYRPSLEHPHLFAQRSIGAAKFSAGRGGSVNNVIHLVTTIDCQVPQAFRLFTEKELLESWLATVAEIEPFIGGSYQLFWNPGDRENDSTIGCRVTAFCPGRYLSFEWKSPRQFKHFANGVDPLTHVSVMFFEKGGKTEVHLLHSGWRSSPEWEEARVWQEKAWNMAFESLKEVVF